MSDKFYVGLDVTGFANNNRHKPISRVTLMVDNDNAITAGDDTGREIVADCPFATQEMADALLAQFAGHEYLAYEADDANIDPAAELGDGVTVGGCYSVIARSVDDGAGYSSLSAPGEAESEDEFPTSGPMTQEFNRQIASTRSSITKTAEEIRLEVATENQKTAASIEALEKQFNADLSELSDEITETLTSYSTITQTSESIAAAVETSKTYTDTKTGEVIAELENYSTIEQTASKIATAVSESKSYTDTEIEALEKEFSSDLGNLESAINVKFESYSTTEQTASKIASAVSESKTYTDTKTGEVVASLSNYSTVEQTASKISSAVSESKTYTDTKTGEVITLLDSYSTIEQTSSKISAAVSGLVNGTTVQSMIDTSLAGIELTTSDSNGSTTFTLKSGTATLCSDTFDLHVKAANIYGLLTASQIDVSELYVDAAHITGTLTLDQMATISFSDLSDSADIQKQINNAALSGGYSKSQINTFISDSLVASPTIMGGQFYDLGSLGKLELAIYTEYGNVPWLVYNDTTNGINLFAVGPTDTASEVVSMIVGGTVAMHVSEYTIYPQLTWDFSESALILNHGTSLPSTGTEGQVFFLHS